LADTHEIAKYARTYIRDTHTHAHTNKQNKKARIAGEKRQGGEKRGGFRKERKKRKEKDQKK